LKTLTDTTVLSNSAAVGRLDLLQQLFGRIFISNEVFEEVADGRDEGYDFYAAVDEQIYPFNRQGWIELVSMAGDEELRYYHSLPRRLGKGEASCLAIARHRGWIFLSDDRLARETARTWQIALSGTLGVLVQAVKRGLLAAEAGDQLLQEMIERGYRSPYSTLRLLLDDRG